MVTTGGSSCGSGSVPNCIPIGRIERRNDNLRLTYLSPYVCSISNHHGNLSCGQVIHLVTILAIYSNRVNHVHLA